MMPGFHNTDLAGSESAGPNDVFSGMAVSKGPIFRGRVLLCVRLGSPFGVEQQDH